jgi:hypothetical protein
MTGSTIPILGHQPTKVERQVPPLRLVVYGRKAVGKTTLAATASRPLFIDLDGSLEGEAVPESADILTWEPAAWQDLNGLFVEAKRRSWERDTWVIDTGNALARFLIEEAVDTATGQNRGENAGMLQIGKTVPELRDYNALAQAYGRVLSMLRRTGKDIIVLCHTRDPDPEHGEYRRGPDLPAATRKVLEEWANVIGEYEKGTKADGTDVRTLSWAPDDPRRVAGNRWTSTLRGSMTDPTIPKIKAAIGRAYRKPVTPKETQ